MCERLGQALKDHPVQFGVGTAHQERDVLAGGTGEIADRARKRSRDHRERQSPHSDRGVLQFVEHAVPGPEGVADVLGHLCVCAE